MITLPSCLAFSYRPALTLLNESSSADPANAAPPNATSDNTRTADAVEVLFAMSVSPFRLSLELRFISLRLSLHFASKADCTGQPHQVSSVFTSSCRHELKG